MGKQWDEYHHQLFSCSTQPKECHYLVQRWVLEGGGGFFWSLIDFMVDWCFCWFVTSGLKDQRKVRMHEKCQSQTLLHQIGCSRRDMMIAIKVVEVILEPTDHGPWNQKSQFSLLGFCEVK